MVIRIRLDLLCLGLIVIALETIFKVCVDFYVPVRTIELSSIGESFSTTLKKRNFPDLCPNEGEPPPRGRTRRSSM